MSRWGFILLSLQMRWTLLREMPSALAMLRMLHRVFPLGGWVALATTFCAFAGGMDGFLPLPGLSSSAGMPPRLKRAVHFETQFSLAVSREATSFPPMPSLRSRMISAR